MNRMLNFLMVLVLCSLAASVTLPAAAVDRGTPAPEIRLPGRDGEIDLAALKGRVVMVDFWASWCIPCRHSFPWMNEMQAKYGPRGFQIIAINVDANRADADGFLAKVPAQFMIAFDQKGVTPRAYGVRGMPTSVLIGADGRVVQQHIGFRDADRPGLEAAIAAAVAKAETAAPMDRSSR
jgi:cytochrome c biogenesis protein CcmG, thiol:disulfide interchange protein DsbE